MEKRKGIASGLLIGAFVGIVFDNMALGILFGVLFGGFVDHQKNKESSDSE